MSALADNRVTPRREGLVTREPVAASTHLYKGSLLGTNASGYAIPASASALRIIGVAEEEADNSTGSNGDTTGSGTKQGQVLVSKTGLYKFGKTGSIAQSDKGKKLYAADDQTLGLAYAQLTTALAGANNDLVWTSLLDGEDGARITIEYRDPAGNNKTESIVRDGLGIVVNLGTDGGGAIVSTGDTIKLTLAASPAAAALVSAVDAAANDGSGVVIAMVPTALALPGPVAGSLEALDGSDVWLRIEAV